jgi:NADPH:quinone reductase-like Zn-dependent oxidoreductase
VIQPTALINANRSVPSTSGRMCPESCARFSSRAAELGITFKGGQVHSDGAQMAELARLIDAGRVRVGIDSLFPLAEADKAHVRAEQGHIQGKIVLRVV